MFIILELSIELYIPSKGTNILIKIATNSDAVGREMIVEIIMLSDIGYIMNIIKLNKSTKKIC